MNEIFMKQNTGRVMEMLAGTLLLIGGGVYLIVTHNHPAVKVVGILVIVFLLPALIYLVFRLLKPHDILIINEHGFSEHTSPLSLKFIPWESVKSLSLLTKQSHHFIRIELLDAEELIKKENKIKRFFIRLDKLFGYHPVTIMFFSYKEQTLAFKTLKKYFEACRSRQS